MNKKMYNYVVSSNGFVFVESRSSKDSTGTLGLVPDSISKSDYGFLKATLNQMGAWDITVDDNLKSDDVSKKAKRTKYKKYIKNIDNEMVKLFKTTKREKATSMFLTWFMMKLEPGYYSDKGLVDDSGSPLDTNTKVYDYAMVNIMKALDYSVFLIKEEEKYKT